MDPDNAKSRQRHVKAFEMELSKAELQDTVLLPLMKSIYCTRRLFVLNDANSVNSILDEYPALSHLAIVSESYLYCDRVVPLPTSFLNQPSQLFYIN